jgi:hypothetical protein
MLKLIEGNGRRRVFGARSLDRAMHSAFVGMQGADGSVPSEAIYDIRRHRQAPWRCLARRLTEARAADTPIEQVKEIARALDLYIDELYNSPGGSAA